LVKLDHASLLAWQSTQRSLTFDALLFLTESTVGHVALDATVKIATIRIAADVIANFLDVY